MTRAATLFLAVATALVVAAVVTGFTQIPTPGQQRIYDIDSKRVRALTSLSWAISSYANDKGKLPDSLDALAQANAQARDNMTDVQSGQPYEYVKGEAFRYQLCATYGAPTQRGTYADIRHPAGRHCIDKNAKPKP